MITAMLMAAALAAEAPPADTFCRRMAAELKMKLDPKKLPQRRVYVASTYTLKQFLFGGNISVMLAIRLPDDSDAAALRRAGVMCKPGPRGAECRPREGVDQYVRLAENREFSLPVRAGETPLVTTNGSSIDCEDAAPPTSASVAPPCHPDL